jgi:hypothetical protein
LSFSFAAVAKGRACGASLERHLFLSAPALLMMMNIRQKASPRFGSFPATQQVDSFEITSDWQLRFLRIAGSVGCRIAENGGVGNIFGHDQILVQREC